MSFRPMVRTGSDPVFYGNALRFATREEAQRSADDLMSRWLLVVDTSVVEVDEPVTHRLDLATGILSTVPPENLRHWTDGSGRITLSMTLDQARACSHPGDCEADVVELMTQPEIHAQLQAVNADALRQELEGYGAWNEADLADHQVNLTRLVWIAACDIREEEAGNKKWRDE